MGTPAAKRRRTVTTGPKRAAIYARISDARDDDTAGVDRQVEDCRALAASRGFDVVEEYVDNNRSAYSGARRPAYERMLADVAAGRIDVIVVWATDRLYRRLADLERLVDTLQGVDVATCHSGEVNLDSADGRLHARMLGTVAQHSSEKAGERITRAAEQRARAGKFGGGKRRFGYTADARQLVPEEAEALRWAYGHILDGGSMYGVVAEWERRGLRGALGGKIVHPTAREYLLRPMNAGLSVYQGVEVGTTGLPTIVDESTWRAVRAILSDPKRRTSVGRPPKTLLAPILRCGVCDGRMHGGTRTVRGVSGRVPIYLCREGHTQRRRPLLDEFVSEVVVRRLEAEREGIAAQVRHDDTPVAREAEALRQERAELETAFARGDLDVAAYIAGMKANTTRREALDLRAAEGTVAHASRRMAAAPDIREAWEAATTETRREVIKELIDVVRIGPTSTPGVFDATTITFRWKAGD